MITFIIGAAKWIKIKNRKYFFYPTLTASSPNIGITASWTAALHSEKAGFSGGSCLGKSRVVHSLFSLLQQKQPITSW
jgi:hypothetical protein